MTTTPTPVQALSYLVDCIFEAIKAAGPIGMPEGHLYAQLMTIPNFNIDHLNLILGSLEKKKLITRKNYLVKVR